MHEALLTCPREAENMLSNTKYDGIPKRNGISGQRARLALLRRRDKGAREASMGKAGGRAQSKLSARPPNALEGPPKEHHHQYHQFPRPSRHQPFSYKFRPFNHTSLLMNPGQDYIDHSIYLTIH